MQITSLSTIFFSFVFRALVYFLLIMVDLVNNIQIYSEICQNISIISRFHKFDSSVKSLLIFFYSNPFDDAFTQ